MGTSDAHEDEQLREELGVFGLSDTEIDTYLALLECGEAPTSTVSEMTDVTQRAVYNIAERLEQRGLVRVNSHASPTTISALPPTEAIGNLSDRLDSIKPSLKARFNSSTTQTPEIQMIKSRETALKRLREAIAEVNHELLLAIPEHALSDVRADLQDAVDRGVMVFLLIGNMDTAEGDGSEYADVASVVRYWKENLPLVYTIDDVAAMIGHSGVISGTHTDDGAVSVTESHLSGSILGMYFSAYWPAATEHYITEPDPLPRTYDWFRQATLHAILHEQAGTDLAADIETEAGVSVSGPVKEIRQAFVEPATNDFTLENSLIIDTGDELVSVGGLGSFLEDYQATSVNLRLSDTAEA